MSPGAGDGEALEALYASLPGVACQGLCWNTCGPIPLSPGERERIRARGVEIPVLDPARSALWSANVRGVKLGDRVILDLFCPALDRGLNRCTVYDVRPLICRVFGAGRGDLACEWGCAVTGPRLRRHQVLEMLMRTGAA